ncbi:MAG: TonB-dependent receptor [Gammaproteobacteria bacterium]
MDGSEKRVLTLGRRCYVLLLGALCSLAGFPVTADEDACEPWVARAASIEGDVELRPAGQQRWIAVKLDERLCEGDSLRVRHNSRAAVILSNDTILRLDQDTTITLTGLKPDQPAWLDLINGIAHFISRVKQSFKVVTPFVNAAVEGTEFVVAVREQEAQITVFEGQVAAGNPQGELTLTGGQSGVAAASQPPVLRTVVKPRTAVHWALYYPPVLELDGAAFTGLPRQWQEAASQSLAAYRSGDVTDALERLEPLPENQAQLTPLYLFRASLYLSVGRVDEAARDLNTVSALNTSPGAVLALQSIIAVTQNETARALEQAQRATAIDPTYPPAALALSYAQQAQFDVEGARETLKSAVDKRADSALLWARLAEIYLSVADLEASLEAAQRATQLNPDLALTQSVLGFAHLARIDLRRAREAFRRAIERDQAAPLPRLGLGLATIRRGRPEDGRRQIELAASLDPSNSLIRSYLGKAYYDEKRDGVAGTELALAKQLDPNDPTPWFYDAIRKQTENRPIEALQDLQKSIELNDNRAVFRSEFLLDQDLAARSASLARIYGDLEFDQLALVEGWKAVNTAPGNYSAHRLLADSYAALPRHDIARVSELLRSQLLQPLNLTPLQPQLAEANLLLYEGLGPSDPSLLEFNPLFTRNRLALQGSGLVGGNDTLGDDLIQSGLHDKWSYSIGQYHFETDGFRDNNDQNQNIYNLFVQNALSYRTSVQGEIRISDINQGDVPLRFDPDDFSETLRRDLDVKTYRLGLRHGFTPRSTLLASAIWADREANLDDTGVSIDGDIDGYITELQHLLHYRQFHLTSGAGSYNANRKDTLGFDLPFGTVTSRERSDIDHDNLYVYAQSDILDNLSLTAGVSYDDYSDDLTDKDQWNPKVGVLWDIAPSTTFRAAALRVLKRTVASDQTIEPTQVAGFNQFYDDPNGAESKRYGAALDHRFSRRLYGGLEYSQRDIDAPYESSGSVSGVERADSEEDVGRAYAYWTPTQSVSLAAEYQYEDIHQDDDYPALIAGTPFTDLKTHRVPLSVTLHRPSGWYAGLKATYVDQEGAFGTFIDPFTLGTVKEQDDFWIVDTIVGYRLPKRYGLVSVGVKNLFDQSFNFQDTDPRSPAFYPERLVFGRVTLSF